MYFLPRGMRLSEKKPVTSSDMSQMADINDSVCSICVECLIGFNLDMKSSTLFVIFSSLSQAVCSKSFPRVLIHSSMCRKIPDFNVSNWRRMHRKSLLSTADSIDLNTKIPLSATVNQGLVFQNNVFGMISENSGNTRRPL